MGDLGFIPGLGRSPAGEGNWLPIPVFLPGESHGQRLQTMGSQRDTTERLTFPSLPHFPTLLLVFPVYSSNKHFPFEPLSQGLRLGEPGGTV